MVGKHSVTIKKKQAIFHSIRLRFLECVQPQFFHYSWLPTYFEHRRCVLKFYSTSAQLEILQQLVSNLE